MFDAKITGYWKLQGQLQYRYTVLEKKFGTLENRYPTQAMAQKPASATVTPS